MVHEADGPESGRMAGFGSVALRRVGNILGGAVAAGLALRTIAPFRSGFAFPFCVVLGTGRHRQP